MSKGIHIKIADRGWILEKCAGEIAERVSSVTYGTHADASADLQYYINYSARSQRVSPVEVAFFTHSEHDEIARQRYFDCAKEVDHCVCMSDRYARELVEAGIPPDKVTVIAPGVDLEEFRPKVRIGVVGRTYHTGRKGEALVAQVMDVPGIEWRFTGSGWPGPSTHVPDGGMADFYNDLDYVLVPALYEGGPMSVLEGLACGVPIISSDVGWVPDYPHIPFENGNAESLREVLQSLVAEREALRSAVEDRTWENWAEGHLQLFDRLLGGGVRSSTIGGATHSGPKVTLLTHGTEGKTQGGPSVRVPVTASALCEIGIEASVANFPSEAAFEGELAHLFNIWPPRSSIEAARAISAAGKRLVVSPILLDLTELDFWQRRVLEVIAGGVSPALIEQLQFEYAEEETWARRADAEPGFSSRVREIADLSDALVFLSERERALFERIAGEHPQSRLIRNPVDATRFADADPSSFREFVELDDFILCVGRIEPRKNQLLLAAAARELGLPLVLIGHAGVDGAYAKAVSTLGGEMVRSIGRIDPKSDMLASAFAAARVFALPSWAEGAPLAALEAAASGANLVLSDRSGEQEYFGDLARYVDPASIESLKTALDAAWNDPDREERSIAVRRKVEADNSWAGYARKTADLYRAVIASKARTELQVPAAGPALEQSAGAQFVVIELSTTFNAKTMTGINRVEALVSRKIAEAQPETAKFVFWDHGTNSFLEIPRQDVLDGTVTESVRSGRARPFGTGAARGGTLLVLGSGWFQNGRYAEAMGTLAATHGLTISVIIHDIIPALRPHWFPDKYAPVFVENLRTMLRQASKVLTYSENSAADVRNFAMDNGIVCPPIFRFSLANEIEARPAAESEDAIPFPGSSFTGASFILSVAAVHKRKNYDLLYDCWLELRARLGASCPHLVIVGGVGWDGRDTARALKEDPRLAGVVHILSGVEDGDLAWLYEHCLFTVYPSLYEGWGLPVAESLAAGKVVLASNTSSIPEIAPELTELIDPTDRAAWVAKITHYIRSADSRRRREQRIAAELKSVAWDATADGILSALAEPAPANFHRHLYSVGEVARLTKGQVRYKSYGWHLTEGFGSWAASKNAGITLVARPTPSKDLVLGAAVRLFGKAGTVCVSANGRKVASWDIPAGPEVLRFATIPSDFVGPDGLLQIDLESPRVIPVRALNPKSADGRSLGLGLSALQVAEAGSDELWNGIAAIKTLPLDRPVGLQRSSGIVHAQGFHPPEPAGLWSSFKEAELLFRLPELGAGHLRFEVWAPLAESARARIIVECEGHRREVRLLGGGNEVVWVPVESGADSLCSATFVVDSMFVPAIHRGSEDKRELGILVKSVAALTATEDEVPQRAGADVSVRKSAGRVLGERARRLAATLGARLNAYPSRSN